MKRYFALVVVFSMLCLAVAMNSSAANSFEQSFDGLTALPQGVSGSGGKVTVAVDPKGAPGACVQLQKAEGTSGMVSLNVSFAALSEPFYASFDVFSPDGSVGSIWAVLSNGKEFPYGPGIALSTGAISAFDGTTQKAQKGGLAKDRWQNIVLEVSPKEQSYQIYSDGVLASTAPLKFRDASITDISNLVFRSSSDANAAFFYVDNIKVVQGKAVVTPIAVPTPAPEPTFLPKQDFLPKNNQVMKEFFVSKTGSDSGDGSINKPFATIVKAKEAVKAMSQNMAGDIVVSILPGEYFIEKTVIFANEDGGSGDYNVIYRAKEGIGTVTFTGAKRITGWSEDKGGIYKAPVDTIFHTLYEKDTRAIKARYPNRAFDANYPTARAPYLLTTQKTATEIAINPKDIENISFSNITDASVVIWPYGRADWNLWVNPIVSVDKQSGVIKPKITVSGVDLGPDARYYIEGMLELLDTEGEFYLDSSAKMLYYKPMYGNPNTETEIYAPVVQRIFKVLGASPSKLVQNLVFKDLAFEKTDFVREGPSWMEWAGTNLRYGALEMENTSDIAVIGCKFQNTGTAGLFMNSRNGRNYVANCLFQNIGTSGLIMYEPTRTKGEYIAYNKIENGLFHKLGENSVDAAGINLWTGQNNLITNIEVYDSPRYALSVRGGAGMGVIPDPVKSMLTSGYCKNNKVQNAIFHHTNQDSGDTGALHSAGVSYQVPDKKEANTNSFENIYIDNIYAHPSMHDVAPNGLFFDYSSYYQNFKNIKVTNQNGWGYGKGDGFLDASQLRFNESGKGTYDNCTWYRGFDEGKMNYQSMGITEGYPVQYLPGMEFAKNGVLLQEGSPNAVVKDKLTVIDENDHGVIPVNVSDRVLVPIRFVAESFGAVVTWNEPVATIKLGNKTIELTQNAKQIKIDGSVKEIDVAATLINDRIMVPIRAVSEALGKVVDYSDGLILISDDKYAWNKERDKKEINKMGSFLLTKFDPAQFISKPIEAGEISNYEVSGTLEKAGEGIMLRSAGSENAAFISAVYEQGSGLAIYQRNDQYAIPQFIHTGKKSLPINIKMIKKGDLVQILADEEQVYVAESKELFALAGVYNAPRDIQINLAGLSLPRGEELDKVSLAVSERNMEVGSKTNWTVFVTSKSGAEYKLNSSDVTIESSNSQVIAVENDTLLCKEKGQAQITAKVLIDEKEYEGSATIHGSDEQSVLLDETFEIDTFDDTKWIFSTEAVGGSYVKRNSTGRLEVYANMVGRPHSATRSFKATESTLDISFDFKMKFGRDTNKTGAMLMYMMMEDDTKSYVATTYAISTFAGPSGFAYYDGKAMEKMADCQSEKDYKVRMVVNSKTSTFDFYLDGNLIKKDAPFRNKLADGGKLEAIMCGSNSASMDTTIWWDNLKIVKEQ